MVLGLGGSTWKGTGGGGPGEEPREGPVEEGGGLPPVPGGWKTFWAAPTRLAAIRVQALLEELGFQVLVLEEALGLSSPLSDLGFPPEYRGSPAWDVSDSHLICPAGQLEEVRRALEVVLEEIDRFDGEG